jgi:hypothetical protein
MLSGDPLQARRNTSPDFWPAERQGYSQANQVAYVAVPVAAAASSKRSLNLTRIEQRLGSLIAVVGLIWAVQVATRDFAAFTRIDLYSPGPLEILGLGFLIWLHAKWRRSVKLN